MTCAEYSTNFVVPGAGKIAEQTRETGRAEQSRAEKNHLRYRGYRRTHTGYKAPVLYSIWYCTVGLERDKDMGSQN